MAENVGGIYYEVDADTSGLLRAEREVDQSTRKMERGLKDSTKATDAQGEAMKRLNPITKGVKQETDRLSGSLTGMSKAAKLAASALAMVGISVGLREALTQVMDFQDAMNGLAAVSGATAEQMAELESQARSLGATSQFSATQAGEAQRFLAQAGFEVNEILGATPGILQLATAGQMDLAQAADIASNVLGGMRMEVDQLNRVNDVLAATASGANTNVVQLGNALSYAAPFAVSAGISIEEASAAIGVMSDAGVQGSRAGTGLIGVIRQLSNVTSAGEGALARYGLGVEDVDIKTHGLAEVMRRLEPMAEDTASAIQLFGSEAGAAAQVLMGANRRLTEFTGELEGAEGKAAEMAATLDQGLRPALRSLQSAMAESILQLGDSGIAGGLENVIRLVTGVISVWNGMGATWAEANGVGERTLRVVEGVAKAIQIMAAMAAGRAVQSIGALIVAKSGLTAGTLTLTGALTGLRTVLMTLFGPVGLIAGAAAALYTFREELGLVGQEATNTARRINQLTEAISTMTATEIASNLEKARMEMRFLVDQGTNLRRVLRDMEPGDTWDGRTYEQLRAQLSGIREDAIVARDGVRELEAALERAQNPAEGAKIELEELDDIIRKVDESTGRAKNETDEFGQSLQRLMDQLFPLEAEQRKFAENQLLLAEAMVRGRIDVDEYREALQRLEEQARNTGEVWDSYDLFRGDVGDQDKSFWEQWLEGAENAFTNFDEMAANTADRFTSAFGSAFERMIFDSQSAGDAFRGLADTMLRSVVRSLGEMAAQWVAYHAVQMALGRTSEAAAIAGAAVTGSSIAAAYAPAAAMASLASFGANAAPAMAGISSTVATAQGLAMVGMAHDGISSVPKEGTWLLDKGERVVGADLNRDLGQFLERERGGRTGGDGGSTTTVTVNLIESAERAGQVVERPTNGDGRQDIDVFVADIMGDGPRSKAIRSKFGLSPRGR